MIVGRRAHLICPDGSTFASQLIPARNPEGCVLLRNNYKRQLAMFKHTKLRQAGLILFGTVLVLIVPNLTRLFG